MTMIMKMVMMSTTSMIMLNMMIDEEDNYL